MLAELLHLSRALRRSPAATAAAVVTLSLTIGAGMTIFALVDAVLLTPLPFDDPDALTIAGETTADAPAMAPRPVPYNRIDAWRQRARSLARIEAFDGSNATLTGLGAAERVSTNDVTAGLLPLLGVAPSMGRGFETADEGQPIAIISHAFWHGRLGADPTVIGRSLTLGGRPHQIIGVLPEPFFFALNPGDIWRPLPMSAPEAARTGYRVMAVARLERRVSPAMLASALDEVSGDIIPAARASVVGLSTRVTGDARGLLGLLGAAAALALVVACVNLAGLLVVRSLDRSRELAVRTALGAGRAELAGQLLIEASALVVLGVAGGVLLAGLAMPLVNSVALQPFGVISNGDVALGGRSVAVVALAAVLCATACGLLPALITGRRNAADVLRRGATAAPRELRLRRVFVGGQVALAFVLLVSMTLLGRSLASVLSADPGFDANGVLTTGLSLPSARYPSDDDVAALHGQLQRGIAARLGPGSVGLIDELPLTSAGGRIAINGTAAVLRAAGPSYFDVMRIPLVDGRPFDDRDRAGAPVRAVVSQRFAHALFGASLPIGRLLPLADDRTAEIIGVAGDVVHRELDEPPLGTIYLSAWQAPSRTSRLVIRSPRADGDVMTLVREEVARLDRDLPVYGTEPMSAIVARSPGVPARRLLAAVFGAFALLAVALGAIGLFGVVAHDVSRRRAELALRIALGATSARILAATLRQSAMLLALGLAAGGLLAAWASRILASAIAGTGGLDAVSVGIPAIVLVVSGMAAVLPAAIRAIRTEALIALRGD